MHTETTPNGSEPSRPPAAAAATSDASPQPVEPGSVRALLLDSLRTAALSTLLIGAGLGVGATVLMPRRALGATRSSRLQWEQRQIEAAAAAALDRDAEAPGTGLPMTDRSLDPVR